MGFSINTNINAMTANMHSNFQNTNTDRSLSALSSGSALGSASYNAAGLAIANELSAQVAGMGQGIRNSNDSIGMLQVADGALQGYNDVLDRVKTLTLQASNGILNDDDRQIIQNEIDTLLESADDIAKNTTFNGINLLTGTAGSGGDGNLITQTGPDAGNTISINFGDAQTSAVLSGTIDVTTQAGASASLNIVDDAVETINTMRAGFGASQNALMSSIKNTSVTQINIAAAESQIRDIDFAAESANFSQANLMSQIGSFAQAQSNSIKANNIAGLLG